MKFDTLMQQRQGYALSYLLTLSYIYNSFKQNLLTNTLYLQSLLNIITISDFERVLITGHTTVFSINRMMEQFLYSYFPTVEQILFHGLMQLHFI